MSIILSVSLIFSLFLSIVDCKLAIPSSNINNRIPNESSNSRGDERINLSMPGTKWCGPGNTASGYDDLGRHRDVDMCCRDHDYCDNIPAGETKHNLTNRDFFTVLDCDCDHEFQKCLRKINSKESNRIGRMYFTLRNHCYHDDNPIIKCDEYDTEVFLHRCVRYKLDERQPKRYQWFDLPLYNDKIERDTADDELYY